MESNHDMNITDLFRLKQDQLIPLIRQVADRVRNSRTSQKHRRLREKLLEACDMVLPRDRGKLGCSVEVLAGGALANRSSIISNVNP